jgi:hypothetical protein
VFRLQFYQAIVDTIGLSSHTGRAVKSAVAVTVHPQSNQTNHHQPRSVRVEISEQQARKLTFWLKVHTESTVDADFIKTIADAGLKTLTSDLA